MAAFRRVLGHRAGPKALGILVPPGRLTRVILRPRPLEWDLVAMHGEGAGQKFCDFDRDEAAGLARHIQQALEKEAREGSRNLRVLAHPAGAGFQAGTLIGDYLWIVCRRFPGLPYQPYAFPSNHDASNTLAEIVPFLWPFPDAEQEYYFNTQDFVRR